MPDDLVTFLRARLAEREAAALAASGAGPAPSWQALGTGVYSLTDSLADDAPPLATTGPEIGGSDEDAARAEHIALHDPARTLREVEAVRGLLDRCGRPGPGETSSDPVSRSSTGGERADVDIAARHLALSYSDHPDYLVEWRP
ncbi:DUF6221 family protein [Streptomyces sp. NBC_00247]|uniref:DUF6221 family protein n=1 Tax=Streptomyces sp. NBC_00247 TaxID=2975689 RepID=UPI002E2A1B5D|nr:DUF6221 family protein [Streptomyces sp. NBC_00247]